MGWEYYHIWEIPQPLMNHTWYYEVGWFFFFSTKESLIKEFGIPACRYLVGISKVIEQFQLNALRLDFPRDPVPVIQELTLYLKDAEGWFSQEVLDSGCWHFKHIMFRS